MSSESRIWEIRLFGSMRGRRELVIGPWPFNPSSPAYSTTWIHDPPAVSGSPVRKFWTPTFYLSARWRLVTNGLASFILVRLGHLWLQSEWADVSEDRTTSALRKQRLRLPGVRIAPNRCWSAKSVSPV